MSSLHRADPAPPATRVLIVDDSAVARAVMSRAIGDLADFVVASAASDADTALAYLARERVDIILLDLEMPGVNGLTALPDLLAAGRGARVLVVSSSCAEGANTTMQALALGAADTLVKPGAGSYGGRFIDTLAERLARLSESRPPSSPSFQSPSVAAAPAVEFDIIAIGASTGGIHALSRLLRGVPPEIQTPILITQHLPESFSPYFAAQVAILANRPCDLAADHLRIRPGRVVVAPGNTHMRCVPLPDGGAAIRLSSEPVASGCLPSVDPMFASLAAIYGPRVLAVVLSGMGRDGLDGARSVRANGGTVIVQDQASSVVWGMPGAIANAGLAGAVLPPEEIGQVIAARSRAAW